MKLIEKKNKIYFYFFAAIVFFLPAIALSAAVFQIEIRGTINPATARYLSRSLDRANEAKADLLLVELDTPGGLVSSVRDMAQAIDRSKIPVIVFTAPAGAAATSAGAILMISSHLAAMAPGTNIGAAHPVGAQGEEIKGSMGEKAVNDISAFARSMAELRKRNAKAASEVVSKSNSYTAEEAKKSNLIEVIAVDKTALWKAIDKRQVLVGENKVTLQTQPPPNVETVTMTLGEKLLNYLSHPNIAAILMSLAIILIYAELSAPGLGLPGILGGLCLIIAFIAFQALPIQMGGLALLVIGIILIISEVFVGSGGVLAIGGSVAVLLGLLWVVDPTQSDLKVSTWVIASTGVILTSGTLLIGYGVIRLKKQSEEARQLIGGGDLAGIQGYQGKIQSINSDGKSGQVFIRGELWNFVSTEAMKVGELVTVKQAKGRMALEVIHKKE